MSDFWYFVGSSDYEPYRWHLSDFNISMWLICELSEFAVVQQEDSMFTNVVCYEIL